MEIAAFSQDVTGAQSHRVLVSGADGFVGRAVIRAMLESNKSHVVAAVRKSESMPNTEPARITTVPVGDISAPTDWSHALQGVDTVVHLAARVHVMNENAANPLDAFRSVNVDGTLQLARQAVSAGVRRFVFVSSIKVNGESGFFRETDAPNPTDPYGVSKLEAEVALQELSRSTGLEVVIVRPPLVYGPGVKANFQSLIRLMARRLPLPFGAINNKRSFVAVDNLANFLRVCSTHPHAANQTFLVSDGHDLSTTELLQAMARAMNIQSHLVGVPTSLMSAALRLINKGAIADRLFGTLRVDITKAQTLLQWTPPLSVDEALRRTVAS